MWMCPNLQFLFFLFSLIYAKPLNINLGCLVLNTASPLTMANKKVQHKQMKHLTKLERNDAVRKAFEGVPPICHKKCPVEHITEGCRFALPIHPGKYFRKLSLDEFVEGGYRKRKKPSKKETSEEEWSSEADSSSTSSSDDESSSSTSSTSGDEEWEDKEEGECEESQDKMVNEKTLPYFQCTVCPFQAKLDSNQDRSRRNAQEVMMRHFNNAHNPVDPKIARRNSKGDVGFKCHKCKKFFSISISQGKRHKTQYVLAFSSLGRHYLSDHHKTKFIDPKMKKKSKPKLKRNQKKR